ncbi:roadblock/LC7 domain-containing protein [Streptomyces sp. NPDC049954]|uniref:roadblock/LC7 domain-containing protein n=1 Tax=Streptomyces sp. NPDC049954 TaxID=3155779 RepID=UPI0034337609
MPTTDNSLTWLLENLLERTPGTRHALVLSRDGLKLCWSRHLTLDQADQLAAICSGIQALAQGASMEFGDHSGGVRHSMTEYHGGQLLIVDAGEGAHLAVVAAEEADPGYVGQEMTLLVSAIGTYLRAEPRTPVQNAGSS